MKLESILECILEGFILFGVLFLVYCAVVIGGALIQQYADFLAIIA